MLAVVCSKGAVRPVIVQVPGTRGVWKTTLGPVRIQVLLRSCEARKSGGAHKKSIIHVRDRVDSTMKRRSETWRVRMRVNVANDTGSQNYIKILNYSRLND